MGTLHGHIIDSATGEPINAKVHVLTANGRFCHPRDAMLKRGPGTPFFFCDGEFEVQASRGRTDILVERGTEYEPIRTVVEMPGKRRQRRRNHPQPLVYPTGKQLVSGQHTHPLRRKRNPSRRPSRPLTVAWKATTSPS